MKLEFVLFLVFVFKLFIFRDFLIQHILPTVKIDWANVVDIYRIYWRKLIASWMITAPNK